MSVDSATKFETMMLIKLLINLTKRKAETNIFSKILCGAETIVFLKVNETGKCFVQNVLFPNRY